MRVKQAETGYKHYDRLMAMVVKLKNEAKRAKKKAAKSTKLVTAIVVTPNNVVCKIAGNSKIHH